MAAYRSFRQPWSVLSSCNSSCSPVGFRFPYGGKRLRDRINNRANYAIRSALSRNKSNGLAKQATIAREGAIKGNLPADSDSIE